MPLLDTAGSVLPAVRAPQPRRAADQPAARPHRRYAELDVLRFVAAASVVAYHYLFRATATTPYMADVGIFDPGGLARYGYLGVDLFFVISGFVIVVSAIGKSPSAFFISRVTRLYPAFWIACTLTALITFVAPGAKFESSPQVWLTNLTMTPDLLHTPEVDGVYWTLLVELKFYVLVLALSLVGITARRLFGLAAGWTAYALLSHVVTFPTHLDQLLVPQWSPYFCAGICFGLAAKKGWNLGYAVLALVNLVYALHLAQWFNAGLAAKEHQTYSTAIVLLVTVAIFSVMAVLTVRRFDRPWVVRLAGLGALTYPLYLVHQNIGYTLMANIMWLPPLVRLTVTLAAVGGLAWLLHRYVEERAARWLLRTLLAWWGRVRPGWVSFAEDRLATAPARIP